MLDADAIPGGSGLFEGLAALNGMVYVLDSAADDILRFDPVLDAVTGRLEIPADIGGGLAAITGPDVPARRHSRRGAAGP